MDRPPRACDVLLGPAFPRIESCRDVSTELLKPKLAEWKVPSGISNARPRLPMPVPPNFSHFNQAPIPPPPPPMDNGHSYYNDYGPGDDDDLTHSIAELLQDMKKETITNRPEIEEWTEPDVVHGLSEDMETVAVTVPANAAPNSAEVNDDSTMNGTSIATEKEMHPESRTESNATEEGSGNGMLRGVSEEKNTEDLFTKSHGAAGTGSSHSEGVATELRPSRSNEQRERMNTKAMEVIDLKIRVDSSGAEGSGHEMLGIHSVDTAEKKFSEPMVATTQAESTILRKNVKPKVEPAKRSKSVSSVTDEEDRSSTKEWKSVKSRATPPKADDRHSKANSTDGAEDDNNNISEKSIGTPVDTVTQSHGVRK